MNFRWNVVMIVVFSRLDNFYYGNETLKILNRAGQKRIIQIKIGQFQIAYRPIKMSS